MRTHYAYPFLLPLLLLTTTLAVPPGARAEGLSRSDKLKVLYSNQFAFDRRGVPLITIRIAEGGSQVSIESTRPVRVFPDGEDGSEVRGGKRWKVKLAASRPAEIEHFVVLARESISALGALRKQLRTWRGRGARCRTLEVGTIFGVKGKVFDNRAYLLVDGPYPSQRHARKVAERYHRKHGLMKVATVPQLKKRPSGRFEARDDETGATIKVRDAIWFAPAKGARLTVRTGRGKPRSYWGQVYVTVDKRGKLAVVNSVPSDRLLAGLVPAEIFPSAPRAALRAQTVAARGDVLAKIGGRHFVDPYLICATVHCQVYRGAGHEHPRTSEAVTATRGKVLVRSDGSLADAVYSASCGGHSEHNDNTWPVRADPNLRGRLDADPAAHGLQAFTKGIHAGNLEAWLKTPARGYCGRSRYNREKYRWSVKIRAARMESLARSLVVGRVTAIKVLQRGVSGRARLVQVQGEQGNGQVRGELAIRRFFGNLRSSMFVVKPVGSASPPAAFRFTGGGWGHGVGMCQTGAIGRAKAGQTYKQILKHYYPRSDLQPLF
jgi:stage II sporulation protein D